MAYIAYTFVNQDKSRSPSMATLPVLVDALRTAGISQPFGFFDFSSVLEHFSAKSVYNAHVQAKATQSLPFMEATAKRFWPMFCFSMEDVVTAPILLELATQMLLPVANSYFQEPALLYSMNAFGTQPSGGPEYKDTHYWHIDGDDRKQMVAFFMLTDVKGPEDGAHMLQHGTHNLPDAEKGEGSSYNWKNPRPDQITTITAPAGAIFIEDPRGFHMAYRPTSGLRLVAWARFGVTDPPVSYGWDRLYPIDKKLIGDRYPTDPDVQQAIHLVVK